MYATSLFPCWTAKKAQYGWTLTANSASKCSSVYSQMQKCCAISCYVFAITTWCSTSNCFQEINSVICFARFQNFWKQKHCMVTHRDFTRMLSNNTDNDSYNITMLSLLSNVYWKQQITLGQFTLHMRESHSSIPTSKLMWPFGNLQ